MTKVLILGGYGNFGKRIAALLTAKNIAVIIAGRNRAKAQSLCDALPAGLSEAAEIDQRDGLGSALEHWRPKVVINTAGPFQGADYSTAEICIAHNTHYIDLADGRDFVGGITRLNAAATQAGVSVISGASTVPGLSSAVIDALLPDFSRLDSLRYGIAPGQKAERGLATTKGILSYVGKRLAPAAGHAHRYGWQHLYRQPIPGLGPRWMANCDVPDLDLFPPRYGLKQIQFSAGIENPLIHLSIWALSWLVRLGLPLNLPRYAAPMLAMAAWFDRFGSADGGMHIRLDGLDLQGRPLRKHWYIVAKNGDGPFIPTIPAVVLATRLVHGEAVPVGAMPCVSLVSLSDYLAELAPFAIAVTVDASP